MSPVTGTEHGLLKIIIFTGENMKEIGESFKTSRESIGISKEEVIKDLNITISQLDNLEDGNINAFKDVFFLKDVVKKYTKYLNLDEDEIMDKFNEFIFGYTSRIPVDDILEQTREFEILEKQNDNKIVSPYTIKRKKPSTLKYVIIYSLAVIVLIVLVILIIKFVTDDKIEDLEYNSFFVVEGRM